MARTTHATTNGQDSALVCRGDLLAIFGDDQEHRLDWLLQSRRDVLVPVRRFGQTRVYSDAIVPIVRDLLAALGPHQARHRRFKKRNRTSRHLEVAMS